jgi:hypothetical protein
MIGINIQILYNIYYMDDYKPISQEALSRGYFFVTHKLLIKKILFISAIAILVILYAALIFRVVTYLGGSGFNETSVRIVGSTYDWAAYHAERAPQDLKLDKAQFTSLGDRRYNITALVENPNEDWAVKSVDYNFVSREETTPTRTVFMNPDEKQLFALTAYESSQPIRNPELVISDIDWYRIDSSFPEIDIAVSNIVFQAASRETVDGVTIELPARVSWQADNNSLYNFWEVSWQIALYNGETLVAMNELKTKDFFALETKNLETVWLSRLARVTRASIFPVLNKLDSDIFKDIYVDPTIDIR